MGPIYFLFPNDLFTSLSYHVVIQYKHEIQSYERQKSILMLKSVTVIVVRFLGYRTSLPN